MIKAETIVVPDLSMPVMMANSPLADRKSFWAALQTFFGKDVGKGGGETERLRPLLSPRGGLLIDPTPSTARTASSDSNKFVLVLTRVGGSDVGGGAAPLSPVGLIATF